MSSNTRHMRAWLTVLAAFWLALASLAPAQDIEPGVAQPARESLVQTFNGWVERPISRPDLPFLRWCGNGHLATDGTPERPILIQDVETGVIEEIPSTVDAAFRGGDEQCRKVFYAPQHDADGPGSWEASLYIYDRELRRHDFLTKYVSRMQLFPLNFLSPSTKLIMGYEKGEIRLADGSIITVLPLINFVEKDNRSIQWSSDEKFLLLQNYNSNRITIYNINTQQSRELVMPEIPRKLKKGEKFELNNHILNIITNNEDYKLKHFKGVDTKKFHGELECSVIIISPDKNSLFVGYRHYHNYYLPEDMIVRVDLKSKYPTFESLTKNFHDFYVLQDGSLIFDRCKTQVSNIEDAACVPGSMSINIITEAGKEYVVATNKRPQDRPLDFKMSMDGRRLVGTFVEPGKEPANIVVIENINAK